MIAHLAAWRWTTDVKNVSGPAPAGIEAAAVERASELTGIPAGRLRVLPGYQIHLVPGPGTPDHQLPYHGQWARDNAQGDLVYAASITVGEPAGWLDRLGCRGAPAGG